MEDDSHTQKPNKIYTKQNAFLQSLKDEWELFWASFTEEAPEQKPLVLTAAEIEISHLSPDELNDLVKKMSSYKKKIHQRIEDIQSEIDETKQKVESVMLVGGDTQDIIEDIEALEDEGFELTEEIQKIDAKLKLVRQSLELRAE